LAGCLFTSAFGESDFIWIEASKFPVGDGRQVIADYARTRPNHLVHYRDDVCFPRMLACRGASDVKASRSAAAAAMSKGRFERLGAVPLRSSGAFFIYVTGVGKYSTRVMFATGFRD